MQWLMLAFITLLFVALTPGVLLRLPPGGSKLTVAAVHGVVFALVYHFTHHIVGGILYGGKEHATGMKKKLGNAAMSAVALTAGGA
jgi:thiamine transporter ThiT